MTPPVFTPEEQEQFAQLFGVQLADVQDEAALAELHKALRQKYHPDNFEKYGDPVVREMAHARFVAIERLAAKAQEMLKLRLSGPGTPIPQAADPDSRLADPRARFAGQDLRIEILTSDPDLKYHLFQTSWRLLLRGEKYRIPQTQAYLIADESHQGRGIGFRESVRLYLTFGEQDSLEQIAAWFWMRLQGHAEALIVEGRRVPLDLPQLLLALRRRTFLRLEAGS
ncbi:MAG: hypothetical protein NW241_15475 [Bacteroidia bacterium]|nr:hypothetical protein [Bacteroidia bacterium]